MREILFRAYDKTMKRYKPFDGEHDTMLISRDGKIDYYNLQNGSGFDEYILEQFTGILDKNGKRIFEGDKIKLTQGIGTVEWFKTQGRFMIWLLKSNKFVSLLSGTTYEVIGNIHDNPELLP